MSQTECQAFWNSRYQATDYAYGKTPNAFFRTQLDKLPAGKILLPADGEGRNGVYAATRGWDVTAFDLSREGRRKAEALAAECGVSLRYLVGTLDEMDFQAASFDALALVFAHFAAEQKTALYRELLRLLKPGGTIIFEAFSKNHFAGAAKPRARRPEKPRHDGFCRRNPPRFCRLRNPAAGRDADRIARGFVPQRHEQRGAVCRAQKSLS